ncbi:polyprenyl synthetase family protein [Naasia sp. SYSU D00948]|uniref:polyprenyl synthetase family protein n=1 Tax=Naasia sp. SYSU D00948 TaxID=2817379 RepID=UPI001FEF7C31|nr:polyprenyl synthetase family protein [Naasia sp. SYSU D00948]
MRLDRLVDERASILATIAEEAAPFAEFSRQFLRGGKRFRALFCWEGWRAVTADPRAASLGAVEGVVAVAGALELFHAAALVHDDIIDRSDTRRGGPSAHRRFEKLHSERGYAGDPASFGQAGAVLLGDMLQSWSDDLLTEGLRGVDEASARSARTEFERMRLDVTAGQYLDLVEERAWRVVPEDDALLRAQRVILYKSAKYSVEAPIVIGARMGGAGDDEIAALRDFGVPLGVAFQLRDDLLGVFGDPAVTGKPAGDDLAEGKRTVLIAIARSLMPSGSRRLLDELLGDPDLSPDQVALLQRTIRESGAVDRVEEMIEDNASRARAALAAAPVAYREGLAALVGPLTQRTS